jgi:hypothetical protein
MTACGVLRGTPPTLGLPLRELAAALPIARFSETQRWGRLKTGRNVGHQAAEFGLRSEVTHEQ